MRRTPSLVAALLLTVAPSACGNGAQSSAGAGEHRCSDMSLSTNQPADVCGAVVRVLPAQRTRSGLHGYFYVALSTGRQIEIVSNLDAMAEAPSGAPPAQWPWVAAGDYVYVQGRYYYDSP